MIMFMKKLIKIKIDSTLETKYYNEKELNEKKNKLAKAITRIFVKFKSRFTHINFIDTTRL